MLIDVAKAIHFAHSRRILHRDIKPDNVMIGGFGEVYVVDWGIALALEPVVALDLPLASQVNEIIGSPAYMAPEMAIGEGRHMSPRTDVYLLGATLHEILTGQPPHISTNPGDMLSNAYLSRPPSYDATVPYELAEIVRAAMARKPVERTASAALFAASLQRFLHHRDSLVLSREAEESQAALEDRLAVDYGLSDDTTTYALFNRARFGFEHALKIWPDNARARLNLQGTLTRMIEYELERGSPGAASALLKELPAPEPELAERVRARDEEVRRAESALDALRDKVDPTRFDRPRAYLAFAGAVSWPLCHWGLVVFDERSGYGVSHALLAGVYGLFFFASVAMGVAQRETLLRQSASGLQTQLVNTLVYAALIALWGLASRLELTVPHTISFTALVASCLFTTAAVTIDRRFLTWGLSMVGALIACLIAPDRALIWLGAGGLVGSGTLGILRFRTKRAEQTYPLSQALAPGSSAE
ncbi:MAG: protein kinase [Myxococcota bacterium]